MIAGWLSPSRASAQRAEIAIGRAGARRVHANAPYEIALYRQFIDTVGRQGTARIRPFDAPAPRPWGRGLVIVRHDVDTSACVSGLGALLDVDLACGIPAATFVRTDGIDYDPRSAQEVLRRYSREPSLAFGLHTSCYLHDDALAALRVEMQTFEALFGFSPRMFTVHGLGTVRADERRRFVETMRQDLARFGFDFSDCHPDFRRYDYVVEDCHLDQATGRRLIYDDILNAPGWISRGETFLLLTHPCYWR
jgi:hypothetical protein